MQCSWENIIFLSFIEKIINIGIGKFYILNIKLNLPSEKENEH